MSSLKDTERSLVISKWIICSEDKQLYLAQTCSLQYIEFKRIPKQRNAHFFSKREACAQQLCLYM